MNHRENYIKKLHGNQLSEVSGGVTIDGKLYTKIKEDDIEGYEYRCRECGYLGYGNGEEGKCPRCNSKKTYGRTGRFYISYERINRASINAYLQSIVGEV